MKWNNPLIVFDLETTDNVQDREIIEIGAVLLVPSGTPSQITIR